MEFDDDTDVEFRQGDAVEVFYRSTRGGHDDYYPVDNNSAGRLYPRMGITDGWIPAHVAVTFALDCTNRYQVPELFYQQIVVAPAQQTCLAGAFPEDEA